MLTSGNNPVNQPESGNNDFFASNSLDKVSFRRTEILKQDLQEPVLVIPLEADEDNALPIENSFLLKAYSHPFKVNFYAGVLPCIVEGLDRGRYYDHGAINEAMKSKLPWLLERSGISLTNQELHNAINNLENHQVSGFRDGSNYWIRISQTTYSPERLEKYRVAIDMAKREIARNNGELVISLDSQYSDDSINRKYAIALGVLHLVKDKIQSGPKFIESCLEPYHESGYFLYNRDRGTRFKTPDLFEADLGILAVNSKNSALKRVINPGVYESQEKTLAYLCALESEIDPANRNISGRREAQILLVDSENGELIEFGDIEKKVSDGLEDLITSLRGYKDEKAWSADLHKIKSCLQGFSNLIRTLSHPDLFTDDFSNDKYGQVISRHLQGSVNDLILGEGFSTQHNVVAIGKEQLDEFGNKQVVSTNPATEKALSWLKEQYPIEVAKAAYPIYGAEFTDPLMVIQHPPKDAQVFVEKPDDSRVIVITEEDFRSWKVVVGSERFGEEYWQDLNTPKGRKLKEIYTITELVEMKRVAEKCQAELFNQIAPDPVPVWKVANGMRGRAFIPGDRFDREKRFLMSLDQLKGVFYGFGHIMVTNLLAQRGTLSFREVLITDREPHYKIPTRMMTIGVSDSFSGNMNTLKREDYLEKSVALYGASLATLRLSFLQGKYAEELKAQDNDSTVNSSQGIINKIDNEIVNIWARSFKNSYNQQVENPVFGQRDVFSESQRLNKELNSKGKLLDVHFDIEHYARLTNELLSLPLIERTRLVEKIIDESDIRLNQFLKFYERSNNSKQQASLDEFKERESLSNTLYSLVNSHYLWPRYSKIESVLGQGYFRPTDFSLKEREWLLTLADVSAVFAETLGSRLADTTARNLFESAIYHAHNSTEFINSSPKLQDGLISQNTAKRYFEAVTGLSNVIMANGYNALKLSLAASKVSFSAIDFHALLNNPKSQAS